MPFEYLDHTADICLQGIGKTVEAAFAEAARATFNLMVDLQEVSAREVIHVLEEENDLDLLLVSWLATLLAKSSLSGMILSRFHVDISKVEGGFSLRGEGWGEPLDPGRHRTKTEVKGVTYAGLRVFQADGVWIAQCVIDI